ncbi:MULTISPECIES: alpha-(1-_3)-arabinofuranosyltransferase domain-containing protein [unclassified Janibacter]|uniref:alpha-(1->3)-arabinofuranosyltransferase domain-containing protein n=1 Tax=unclassified Janibacter TaxID=2649294 RepID=UPI003CFFA1E4
MRNRALPDGATLAALITVWAVAWSVTPGRIAEDTKNDLYVNAWGFLARSLHLWDSQVSWGGLSNQGYGYLFPMGPFFALGSEVAPVWVVQRLWWALLLSAGLIGMIGLLRALGAGPRHVPVIGGLAYVLAPRAVSSIGGLSAEIQPQLLAPLVLWPLVLATSGRMSTGRAATLSGVAVLFFGGVNATAAVCALVPAGLWLVTRPRWWAQPITWAWPSAVLAATAWWLGPLLLMGRYSPPFLDWIETARAVMLPVGMLDVVRGTTHWLGHVATPGGPWWPAGFEIATSPWLIVLTTAVSAIGLGGLATRDVPERRWLWACLILGGVTLSLSHAGALASPLVDEAQAALDGPLAPLRNIHKVDLLVRLPLAVGLTHLVGKALRWRPAVAWLPTGAVVGVSLMVIAAAAPAFSGAIAVRGTFEDMPQHWRDAGRWLDAHEAEGQALVVPAANFGEYSWGRTIDEPLRPLTDASYAVRDAVPLAPAGTIRLLDEIERRLQTGRSLDGGAEVLSAAGTHFVIVRNDLSPTESGQPPVALARSSVRATAGVSLVKAFGTPFIDASGARVRPVEIYELPGRTASPVEVWRAADVTAASGASEDLAALAESGLATGPVLFDGDRNDLLDPTRRVETDGNRARIRWFGAPRGQDGTSTLTSDAAKGAPDYHVWSDGSLRTTTTYTGIEDVRASSSMADDLGFGGLRPARRPFAALDGDTTTAWLAMWDERPRLTVRLDGSTAIDEVVVAGADGVSADGINPAAPTRVAVRADDVVVTASLTGRSTRVGLPRGRYSSVSVEILSTESGTPAEGITGLSEVTIPGVAPRELLQLPAAKTDAPVEGILLGQGLRGRDGCATDAGEFVCLGTAAAQPEQSGDMGRSLTGSFAGSWTLRGTLTRDSTSAPTALTRGKGVSVEASSARSESVMAQPAAMLDGDARTAWSPAFGDDSPELEIGLGRETSITTLRFRARDGWVRRAAPAVVIDVGGREYTRRLQADGTVEIPPTTGRVLRLTFVRVPGTDAAPAPLAALELEELDIEGVEPDAPDETISAACGEGPRVVVDGRTARTRATMSRDAVLGLGTGTWEACGDVTFGDGLTHTVTVDRWQGLTIASAALRPSERASRDVAIPLGRDATLSDETPWEGTIAASGEDRVLVMDQNANAGWEARLGETPLEPVVIDGRRQAFVLPAGGAGDIVIEFGPDRTYRVVLAIGAVAALGLLGCAIVVGRGARSRSRAPQHALRAPETARAPARWAAGGWVVVGVAGVLGAVVAGVPGLVAALLAGVASRLLGRTAPTWSAPAIVVGTLTLCGLLQAVVSPGSLGPAWLEGGIRLAIIAVVTMAALAAPGKQARDAT